MGTCASYSATRLQALKRALSYLFKFSSLGLAIALKRALTYLFTISSLGLSIKFPYECMKTFSSKLCNLENAAFKPFEKAAIFKPGTLRRPAIKPGTLERPAVAGASWLLAFDQLRALWETQDRSKLAPSISSNWPQGYSSPERKGLQFFPIHFSSSLTSMAQLIGFQ